MGWYGMIWYGMVWYGMVCYGMPCHAMLCYAIQWYALLRAHPLLLASVVNLSDATCIWCSFLTHDLTASRSEAYHIIASHSIA